MLPKALENLIKALAEQADVIRGWVALNSDIETFKIPLILDKKRQKGQMLTSSLQDGGQNEVISLNYR